MYNEIINILPIPQRKVTLEDKEKWINIKKEIDFEFPEDYIEFINIYGTGGINEFVWILSPFEKNENLNLLFKFNEMKMAYQSMQNEFPEKFSRNFHENSNGLFPWGITDNGDELYWHINNKKWSIVVIETRYAEIYEYSMGMTEFIYKLLKREIQCKAFPDDFLCNDYYYETI